MQLLLGGKAGCYPSDQYQPNAGEGEVEKFRKFFEKKTIFPEHPVPKRNAKQRPKSPEGFFSSDIQLEITNPQTKFNYSIVACLESISFYIYLSI